MGKPDGDMENGAMLINDVELRSNVGGSLSSNSAGCHHSHSCGCMDSGPCTPLTASTQSSSLHSSQSNHLQQVSETNLLDRHDLDHGSSDVGNLRKISDYKTYVKGLMDIALLSANSTQMRQAMLFEDFSHRVTMTTLLGLSIFLQIVASILLVIERQTSRPRHYDRCHKYNLAISIIVVFIIILNVLTAAFFFPTGRPDPQPTTTFRNVGRLGHTLHGNSSDDNFDITPFLNMNTTNATQVDIFDHSADGELRGRIINGMYLEGGELDHLPESMPAGPDPDLDHANDHVTDGDKGNPIVDGQGDDNSSLWLLDSK